MLFMYGFEPFIPTTTFGSRTLHLMLLFPCFGIERTSKPNLKLQQSPYLSPLTLYVHCLIRHVLLPDSRHGLRSTHLSSMPISLIGDVRCRVSRRAFLVVMYIGMILHAKASAFAFIQCSKENDDLLRSMAIILTLLKIRAYALNNYVRKLLIHYLSNQHSHSYPRTRIEQEDIMLLVKC